MQIPAADSPRGPFRPLSAGPVTPPEWECPDGAFFVTVEGNPWMVFCREWVQAGDGETCTLPLCDDLASAAGEPVLLFRASQAPWSKPFESKGRKDWVTDGPWLHRPPGGELLMLWSNSGVDGCAIGLARSASGQLLDP
jgi:arabinan endo-1,5-alpha-L-arabinosidase